MCSVFKVCLIISILGCHDYHFGEKTCIFMVNCVSLTKKGFGDRYNDNNLCVKSPCNKFSFVNCTMVRSDLWTEKKKAFFAVAMEMKKVFFFHIFQLVGVISTLCSLQIKLYFVMLHLIYNSILYLSPKHINYIFWLMPPNLYSAKMIIDNQC